jgi:hypothetical protein
MVTESVLDDTAGDAPITSGALAVDLAADPADILDVAAALGVEFRRVVAELRRAPASPAPRVLDDLTSLNPRPRARAPHGDDAAPFVWVRLVPSTRATSHGGAGARDAHEPVRVRAGWLDLQTAQAVIAEARAAGPATAIQIIVPLDSRAGTADRVRMLCAALGEDIELTIDVQRDTHTSRGPSVRRTRWWGPSGRASRDARPEGRGFRPGAWVVLNAAATS